MQRSGRDAMKLRQSVKPDLEKDQDEEIANMKAEIEEYKKKKAKLEDLRWKCEKIEAKKSLGLTKKDSTEPPKSEIQIL